MIVRNVASQAVFQPDKMGKVTLAAGGRVFAGLNCFEPGQTHKLHTHAGQDKLYFVIEGTGEVTVGAETESIGVGDLVLAPSGEEHALSNPGPGRLVVIAVLAPPPQAK